MNERQWWSRVVQPRWHKPEKNQLAWKMQDAFIKGRPDVLINVPIKDRPPLVGWVELKYDTSWPKRNTTMIDVGLTAEQYRHLDAWYRATRDWRTAVVFYGVADEWFLFKHDAYVLKPGTSWPRDEIIEASQWLGGKPTLANVLQDLSDFSHTDTDD